MINKSKNHLDIDLEFLDKKEPLRVNPADTYAGRDSKPSKGKRNGYIYLGIVFVILYIIGSLSDNKSSTASSSYDSGNRNGQYSCTSYDSDKSDRLKPDSSFEQIKAESEALDRRAESIKALGIKIDGMSVNKYSQSSIDSYNKLINQYNTEMESLKHDVDIFEQKNKKYEEQVDVYNAYLEANCTKRY